MCTVSWVHGNDGYELLCNRDEKRNRLPALGPSVRRASGVRYIAPSDGNAGGSWIAVNEYGLTLALLNRHDANQTAARLSRGYLTLALADARCIEEAGERIRRADLSRFPGFTLAAFEAGKPCMVFEWDGHDLAATRNAEHRMPLTSSSFDPEAVTQSRTAEFSRQERTAGHRDANLLADFHRSHNPTPSAYSTCMHRPDAQTVSFTRIRVTGAEVNLFYSPAAPCAAAPGETVRLTRKVPALAQ